MRWISRDKKWTVNSIPNNSFYELCKKRRKPNWWFGEYDRVGYLTEAEFEEAKANLNLLPFYQVKE